VLMNRSFGFGARFASGQSGVWWCQTNIFLSNISGQTDLSRFGDADIPNDLINNTHTLIHQRRRSPVSWSKEIGHRIDEHHVAPTVFADSRLYAHPLHHNFLPRFICRPQQRCHLQVQAYNRQGLYFCGTRQDSVMSDPCKSGRQYMLAEQAQKSLAGNRCHLLFVVVAVIRPLKAELT